MELTGASVRSSSQSNFCGPVLPPLPLMRVVPESTPPVNTCTQTSPQRLLLRTRPCHSSCWEGSREPILKWELSCCSEGCIAVVGGVLTTLACDKGANDRTYTHCEPKWGYLWMGAMFQVSRISGKCNYKDYGMGWPLLRAINALERDNERLSVINHGFEVKCESQKPPWQDIKTLSSLAARGRKS